MNLLNGFSADAKQHLNILLSDGSKADFNLEYRPMQTGWYFNLQYNDFSLNGQRLTCHPNILRQFRNVIPFGLSVLSNNDLEPLDLTNLSDGTVSIYLLDSPDVASVEAQLFPGNE